MNSLPGAGNRRKGNTTCRRFRPTPSIEKASSLAAAAISLMMLELAVTLTDYALAVQCAVLAAILGRRGADVGWVIVFAATSLGAFFGGTVHGFLPGTGVVAEAVWVLTLLSIGATAAALVRAAVVVGWGGEAAGRLTPILVMAMIGYTAVVLFVSREFAVSIGAYLPAALFLMFAFARNGATGRPAGVASAIAGVMLALLGAVLQYLEVGLHPTFDHNAVYHVVQAVALFLVFRAALQAGAAR